jgi:hypothetical protein
VKVVSTFTLTIFSPGDKSQNDNVMLFVQKWRWFRKPDSSFFLNQVTSHLSPGLGTDFFPFPPGPPDNEDNALNDRLTVFRKVTPCSMKFEGVWAGIAQSVQRLATGRGIGVRVPVGTHFFSSPRRTDRFCGPPSLLSNGYRGLFPSG